MDEKTDTREVATSIDVHHYRRRSGNNVLILYTGGTIGMIADPENGGALTPNADYIRQELANVALSEEQDFPEIVVEEFEELVDSSDMDVDSWVMIANVVEKNYYDFDGFVVICGTDTMSYAASALSFMLNNLSKPVIFTGSMIPLFKGYSDARRNLLLSISIAATSRLPEVCVFFHDKLLRGNRSTKYRSNGLDAFTSPNMSPLAYSGTSLTFNEALMQPPSRKKFHVLKDFDTNVLVIKLIPGFSIHAMKTLLDNESLQLKALVLEVYGVGNAPTKRKVLVDCLKAAVTRGVVVAVCSQCLHGEVNLMAYEVGKSLHDIGAISTMDMTVEAVTTKLAFLFGQGFSPQKVKEMMTKSLHGELTERS